MTSSAPFLPFINRNLPNTLDISESGIVAYASRSSIYFSDFKSTVPVILDSKVLHNTHNGKALSISLCKSGKEDLIATLGEDFTIKVWDLETRECIAEQEVKEFCRVVEWLRGSPDSIVFPDSFGCVSRWNFKKNIFVRIKTGSESHIVLLSSNPKYPEFLAAGHTVGTISILNINSQVLLHKLKAHTMQLTSLCWSPISPTMLLSTSMDLTARVWKMGEENSVNTFIYPKSRVRYEDKDKKNSLKTCGTFHPENPDAIICSNVRGDVSEVLFRENQAPKVTPYDTKSSDTPFKSVNIMRLYSAADNKKRLLTSDHLKFSLFDLTEKKFLSSFQYMSGNIYDLQVSPINSHNLAVATGDGVLKVWDVSQQSRLEITTVVVQTRIKIMSLAWHPVLEGIIAFGSDEGRIGVADFSKKKNIYSYETHHGNSVYCMQWAPCSKIKESPEDYFLYSCGSGIIYIHELHKPKEKPVDFDDLIMYPPDLEMVQKTHSELSWKSDFTCVVIGSFKGFFDIYDNKLNFLTRVTSQMKVIECVKWHPRYTFTSPNGSGYSSWFASTGSEVINIFDASDITKGDSETVLKKPTRMLVGHKRRISSICWSPHTDGFLASACRDGTVSVWNVITSTMTATYMWHRDLVFTVQWSMFDPDIVYSGGMDNCLRVWKISDQPQTAKLEKSQMKQIKKKLREPTRKKLESGDHKSTCPDVPVSKNENDMDETNTERENLSKEEVSSKESIGRNAFTKGAIEKRMHLFPCVLYSSKEKNLENILKVADLLSQKPDMSDPDNMTLISDLVTAEESINCGFYCDQLTTIKMLETKAKSHDITHDKATYLNLMTNNIEPLITSATEKKQLTDMLVAAAATVSRKFYNEVCKKYALQLIEDQRFFKACMYLLFCGDLFGAIKLLIEKGKVLEALALAKCRLPDGDPFLAGVLLKAAGYFARNNIMENEATCYLAMNDPLHAAAILYRCADPKSMYTAVYVCCKFNYKEEAESYGYFCMEKCLSQSDWPTLYDLVELLDSIKVYKVLFRVHELIFNQMKALKKDALDSNKVFGVTGNKLRIWESKTFGDSNISLLPLVYDILKIENILPEDRESLKLIYEALVSMNEKRKKYANSAEEAHVNVAINVSQVIITSLLDGLDLVTNYFLKAFSTTYNLAFLPRVMCWLLLPFDVFWCSSKNTILFENKYSGADLVPFTAYFQTFYDSVLDTFSSIKNTSLNECIICNNISSNLEETLEQVMAALSKKTPKDSLLLYFSIGYLNELKRLSKGGWKFRCYNSSVTCTENEQLSDKGNLEQIKSKDYSDNGIGIEEFQRSTTLVDIVNIENKIIKGKEENGISSCNLSGKFVEGDVVAKNKDNNINVNNDIGNGQHTSEIKQNGISTVLVDNKVEGVDIVTGNIDDKINENTPIVNLTNVKSVNGTVPDTTASNICNKLDEAPLSEHPNESGESKETSPTEVIDEYEHLQCWSDVSLCYVLAEYFVSVICKDEYTLLFYLKKCLNYLDNSIANISRQQSAKSAQKNESTDAPKVIKNDSSNEVKLETNVVQNGDKLQEMTTATSPLKDGDITVAVEENNSNNNGIDCAKIESGDGDSAVIEDEVSDNVVLENKDECNTDIRDKSEMSSCSSVIDSTLSVIESTFSIIEKVVKKNEDSATNVPSEKIEESQLTSQKVSEKLQAEHKDISEKINLLNSVEFCYPSPFDAVSALSGICCDIFLKHPCGFVKAKFHELLHEVNKWNVKFCTENETVKCDICHETASA